MAEHVTVAQPPADTGTSGVDPASQALSVPGPGAEPSPGALPSDDPEGSASGTVPAPGSAWAPPTGEAAPSTVGVATSPPPPLDGAPGPQPGYAAWPPPPVPGQPYPQGAYPPPPYPPVQPYPSAQPYPPGPYAPAQPYPPGPYAPAQPYPPGPYPSAVPYPAPSIGRQPPQRSSWAAPSPTRTHRWGLGAYLLAEAVFLLTSAFIGIVVVGDAGPTAATLAVALSVPTVLAASTALLITRVRGNGPRIDLGLVWSWRDLGLGLAFGFGGLALTIPASIVYVAIVGEDATSAVGDVFGGIRAGPALAALVLVIVVIVAPMCEEILYRGLLWGGIEKLAGRWVAFAVSTLLFAIAHFEFTRTPLLLIVAIPIAIARLHTGRLLASIVAHQINNLLPGIVLVLGLLGVQMA